MDGLISAWLVAEGIVAWRTVRRDHKPPVPGQLAGVTLLYAGLVAVGAAAPQAKGVVTLLAWGLNVAGILDLWPRGLSGQVRRAQAAEAAGEGVRA